MSIKRLLFILVQITWGLPQTLIGFVVFLCNINAKHKAYHGTICTYWKRNDGVSLGLFIFVSDESIISHEYGHSIQSLIFGPLYLLIVGIPSFLWARLKIFDKYRIRNNISYYDVYPENLANKLGQKVITKKSNKK